MQVVQMTFKCNVVLMFCLSMWTLNQAPDEILESQSVRVSHPKVTKTKLPRLQRFFVFLRLFCCHVLNTLFVCFKMPPHRFSDVLIGRQCVSCEIRDAKFSSEIIALWIPPHHGFTRWTPKLPWKANLKLLKTRPFQGNGPSKCWNKK